MQLLTSTLNRLSWTHPIYQRHNDALFQTSIASQKYLRKVDIEDLEYKFKAAVTDGTATAQFTIFTKAGEKITGHPCSQIHYTPSTQRGAAAFVADDVLDIQPTIQTEASATPPHDLIEEVAEQEKEQSTNAGTTTEPKASSAKRSLLSERKKVKSFSCCQRFAAEARKQVYKELFINFEDTKPRLKLQKREKVDDTTIKDMQDMRICYDGLLPARLMHLLIGLRRPNISDTSLKDPAAKLRDVGEFAVSSNFAQQRLELEMEMEIEVEAEEGLIDIA
ncbi:hypothetical protein Tco_0333439 [Tanacetum coccineum]